MSQDLLNHFLVRYNAFLADKLKVDLDQIKKISTTFLSSYEAPASTVSPVIKSEPSTKPRNGVCTYLLKSGKNKGQPCGAKEKVAGSSRCKTHEGKEEDSKPATKSTSEIKKEAEKQEVSNGETSDEGEDSSAEIETVKPVKTSSRSSKSKRVAQLQRMEQQDVIKQIQQRRCDVPITKSPFGNYVHTGTCLAWDRETSSVKGRELANGQVVPLTENDIQLCVANGWKYKADYRISKPQLDEDDSKYYEEDVESSEDDDEEN